MTAEVERSAIGTMFQSGWGSRTGIAWPNSGYKPTPLESWVRFSISQGNKSQIEIGGDVNQHRAQGIVFVQVFVPEGTGDQAARALCDEVAQLFRAASPLTTSDGQVIFRDAVIRDIGVAAPHYQFNVSIPYLYDTL